MCRQCVWLCGFHHEGHTFDLESNSSAAMTDVDVDLEDDRTYLEGTATSLLPAADPELPVIEVQYGFQKFQVTQKAKASMVLAVDATSNQPTPFYKCLFTIQAAADILEVNLMEYSAPQQPDELSSFDWDSVVAEKKDTFPKATNPDDEDYEKVRTVHALVKKEKDAESRARGYPKSTVQAYVTMKQRWKQWRDIVAVYRHMNPNMALQTLLDLMTFELKLCPTGGELEKKIGLSVKKHLAKLAREKSKRRKQAQLDAQLAEVQKKEEEAKRGIEEVEVARQAVAQEIKDAEAKAMTGRGTRRSRAAKVASATSDATKRQEELDRELEEAKAASLALEEEKKRLEEAKNKAVAPQTPAEPKKKKAKRHDTTLLDLDLSPRKKFQVEGDTWKPPTRSPGNGAVKYNEPGGAWKDENERSVRLLLQLVQHLSNAGALEMAISFRSVMEFVDGDKYKFADRCFIHLVALELNQYW